MSEKRELTVESETVAQCRLYTEADVHGLAYLIAGHPDARVGSQHRDIARAVLDVLAQQGRLLPSEREVERRWAVRWYLPDGGVDEHDCPGNGRETGEQRARRLCQALPRGAVSGEAVRYDIHTVEAAVFKGVEKAEARDA